MIFGAQYYRPPFPGRQYWEADFLNMKKLGFNTVKLWAVWNWIEAERDKFDFSDLDELCALAKKHGLEVVINTIPEGAPHWTLEGNEDARYRTARGEIITNGGPPNLPSAGWPGLCMDKSIVADRVARFIRTVAERYHSDENVISIDVWNEPHLEPMFDFRGELLCYCEHSRKAFRTWLKDKYGTIDKLNAVWFRKHADWEEIQPPPRFGTWTDMLDWRLFWIANLASYLRIRVSAARLGAPKKIIQTHVAYSATIGNKMTGGLANELGDEFSLAKEVDVFGLTSFPKWLQGKNHPFVQLAHNEVVAEASRGKRFYQVELQGGGGKAGFLGGEVPTGGDITVWNYNTIAAGGKGVLYWQYAPEPAGLESPGFGLTAFDGSNNERSLAAGRCAQQLTDPRLDQATRVLPVNAIYLSRKSEALCFSADRKEDLYAGSVMGVYRAAYQAHIPIRFVHEDYLSTLSSEGIKCLYVPMALSLSDSEITAFRAFVEAGGTLIGEAVTGMYDKSGLLDQESKALDALFGVTHKELDAFPDWGYTEAFDTKSKSAFWGSQYRRIVEPQAGTEILARFSDGVPAATTKRLGPGCATFIATFAALELHLRGTGSTESFLSGLFVPGGYPQMKSISVQGQETEVAGFLHQPIVRLLETPEDFILVAVNHRNTEVTLKITLDQAYFRDETLTLTLGGESGVVRYLKKWAI